MEKYDVYVHSWSYHSSSEKKFTGTVKELKERGKLYDALKNKNPRTQNGLQKALNQYASKIRTSYTGITYDVFVHYGD